jgi:hypothetical protein
MTANSITPHRRLTCTALSDLYMSIQSENESIDEWIQPSANSSNSPWCVGVLPPHCSPSTPGHLCCSRGVESALTNLSALWSTEEPSDPAGSRRRFSNQAQVWPLLDQSPRAVLDKVVHHLNPRSPSFQSGLLNVRGIQPVENRKTLPTLRLASA